MRVDCDKHWHKHPPVSWSCHRAGQSSPMMMEPGPDCENASADHDWHPHRQEHGHPPQLIIGHPLTRWPRHTMSCCHHLHICFNQHTGSSSRINISDMRNYKWFESIKVMYSGEVVFIFSSFLMIFLFSPIPIPQNFPCGVCPIS